VNPATARAQFAQLLTAALNSMGIPAEAAGRNDIMLDGKKVSGMAQFVRGNYACTHGSVLFDTDLSALAGVLRVDDEKFRTKAVKSIRERVGNIKDYAQHHDLALSDANSAQFAALLLQVLLHVSSDLMQKPTELSLNTNDLAGIDEIYQAKYGNPEWALSRTPKFSVQVSKRFAATVIPHPDISVIPRSDAGSNQAAEGTASASKRFAGGRIDAFFEVKKGRVERCSIHGDFLGTAPMCELETALVGSAFTRADFAATLCKVDLSAYLGDISAEELLSCVFD